MNPIMLGRIARTGVRSAASQATIIRSLPCYSNAMLRAVMQRGFATLPSHEVVGLPALSPTMTHGNLADWKLKEGDTYSPGDVICSVETDKATVDFEAQDDGVIAKILVQAGSHDVAVGAPIFVSVESADDVAAFKDFKAEAEPVSASKAEEPEAVSTANKPAPKPEVVPLDKAGSPISPGDFLVTAIAPPTPAPKAPVATPAAPASKPAAAPASKPSKPAAKPKKSSALAGLLGKQQQAYIEKFGFTGTTPVAFASEKK